MGHSSIIIMDSHSQIHHHYYHIRHYHHHNHHYHHHILKRNKNKMIRPFVGNKSWEMSIHSLMQI